MAHVDPIWLVYNRASGSNDEAALRAVEAGLAKAGFRIARRSCFPEEPAPDAATLKSNGIDTLCVFAGDGTVNGVVTGLFGWPGSVLVLPGGTQNLLSRRLHGEADVPAVLERITRSGVRTVRPLVLQGRSGVGLTGALLGPGTAWAEVREAMRDFTVGAFAGTAIDAASQSLAGDRVFCTGLEDVRPEGYVAMSIDPGEDGITVKGYFAEGPADVAGQLVAMVQGDFRNGPHDVLGVHPRVEIKSSQDRPMGLLIDGETREAGAIETFTQTRCAVDLLATVDAA